MWYVLPIECSTFDTHFTWHLDKNWYFEVKAFRNFRIKKKFNIKQIQNQKQHTYCCIILKKHLWNIYISSSRLLWNSHQIYISVGVAPGLFHALWAAFTIKMYSSFILKYEVLILVLILKKNTELLIFIRKNCKLFFFKFPIYNILLESILYTSLFLPSCFFSFKLFYTCNHFAPSWICR